MFVLQCKIYIGKYVFEHVNKVVIDSSRSSLADKATVTLPQKYSGEYLAAVVSPGDEVEIWLGYKPELKLEFKGYVTNVQPNTPVEISCEDEMYNLKRQKPVAKAWKSTTLKEVLGYLVPGARLEVPGINLTNFKVDGKGSVAYALQKIKETYGLDLYFRNGKLFAGLAYTDSETINERVKYNLEKNVINPQLNFRKLGDVKLRVKAISILPNNTKLEAEVGDLDGALKTIHFYNLATTAELQQQAEQTLKYMQFDGFEGSIQTFGIPFSTHGQVAEIEDPRFETRKGNYLIDRVVVSFGTEGFRRQNYIGRRAS